LFQPTQKSLVDLYAKVMRMDQREVNAILSPLIARLRSEHDRHKFGKDNIVYWVLKADQHFSTGGYKDRGIFSCYLLNLVHMVPGEAVHLPARELHAYLEGTGVEIMASSNNVLRGGFTLKHIDGEELLKILTFNCNCCQKPEILSPKHGATHGEWDIYETPAEEFVLSRLHLTEQGVYESETEHSMQLGIVIEGSVVFSPSEGTELHLSKGDSFLVPHGVVYGVSTDSEALIFQASVPSL
jgi:mannose-6-phosphate isomerase